MPSAQSNDHSAPHMVLSEIRNRADVHEPQRQALYEAFCGHVVFDGWTAQVLQAAADDADIPASQLVLLFPGGVRDAIDYFFEQADINMLTALEGLPLSGMKIREKILEAIWLRLMALEPNREAARRASATLALPFHTPLASRLIWRATDRIWRGIGDSSTDFNFYSKRTTLVGVWTTTFMQWLADEDDQNRSKTRHFLEARIENVMQFEKIKANLRQFDPAAVIRDSMLPAVAWLRYPDRRDS